MIELASHATYGAEEDVTYAEVDYANPTLLTTIPGIHIVAPESPPGLYIVRMPRYQKFTAVATRLLTSPAILVTIAGNRQIMVTAVVPRSWTFSLPDGEFLFSLDILTDPRSKRVALRMPVEKLDRITGLIEIEHIYDY